MKKIKIYPKKERYIFETDGCYTNGFWILKKEFCEGIWEKDFKSFNREIPDALTRFGVGGQWDDAVELTPSRFLEDTNAHLQGQYARRYDSALQSEGETIRAVYIDEVFHLMFKKALGYKFKFFGSSKEKPILITTQENEFVGVVMGMRL